MFNKYLRQDQVCPNWKDILLVGEVLPWLYLLWLVLQKKTLQFGIFVFVAVQETNWRGN